MKLVKGGETVCNAICSCAWVTSLCIGGLLCNMSCVYIACIKFDTICLHCSGSLHLVMPHESSPNAITVYDFTFFWGIPKILSKISVRNKLELQAHRHAHDL